jgi:hypothetical protein
METIEILNKGNINARIQKDSLGYHKVTKMINKDQVIGSKEFKTLKGATLFANKHING